MWFCTIIECNQEILKRELSSLRPISTPESFNHYGMVRFLLFSEYISCSHEEIFHENKRLDHVLPAIINVLVFLCEKHLYGEYKCCPVIIRIIRVFLRVCIMDIYWTLLVSSNPSSVFNSKKCLSRFFHF